MNLNLIFAQGDVVMKEWFSYLLYAERLSKLLYIQIENIVHIDV